MGRSAVQPGARRPLAGATGASLRTLRHLLATQPALRGSKASRHLYHVNPEQVLLLRGPAKPRGAQRRRARSRARARARGGLSEGPTRRLRAGAGAGEPRRGRALRAGVTPVGRRGGPRQPQGLGTAEGRVLRFGEQRAPQARDTWTKTESGRAGRSLTARSVSTSE